MLVGCEKTNLVASRLDADYPVADYALALLGQQYQPALQARVKVNVHFIAYAYGLSVGKNPQPRLVLRV